MKVIEFDLEKIKHNLNGFACYILGRSYEQEENGATKNIEEALKYYYKGMREGNPLCEYAIGVSLIFGDIIEKDENKGNKLVSQAYSKILEIINNKNISFKEKTYSKFIMGAYYYFGLGDIKKDERKAFEIIYECAQNGHLAAMYDLGANFYYNGIGIDKDMDKAEYYLNIAKNMGLPRAIKKYNEYGFENKNNRK